MIFRHVSLPEGKAHGEIFHGRPYPSGDGQMGRPATARCCPG